MDHTTHSVTTACNAVRAVMSMWAAAVRGSHRLAGPPANRCRSGIAWLPTHMTRFFPSTRSGTCRLCTGTRMPAECLPLTVSPLLARPKTVVTEILAARRAATAYTPLGHHGCAQRRAGCFWLRNPRLPQCTADESLHHHINTLTHNVPRTTRDHLLLGSYTVTATTNYKHIRTARPVT